MGGLLLSQGPKSHRSHASLQNYEEGYILWFRRWGVFTRVHAYATFWLKIAKISQFFFFLKDDEEEGDDDDDDEEDTNTPGTSTRNHRVTYLPSTVH